MLGGVLRKPGVVAGPGLIALKSMPQTLGKDNEIARVLSKRMTELGWIEIVIPVETNIIFFKFTVEGISASALQKYMDEKGNIKC
jgi:threonine aldolase